MVDDLIGKRLAKYEIQGALGEGGMARVYLALDTTLKRTVALKVIAPDLSAQERYRERFEREAQAIAALDHPKIVPVYEFDHVNDLYFMVLKFIEGEDLGRLMNRYAAAGEYLPTEDIMLIVDGMSNALDYAHSKGVIHRDVKPSNIMIDRDGTPYLSDFGLALNLAEGTVGEVLGTPHYVSPEQARDSSSAVPQSDIYSLGVVLFELFTGVVPFDDPSPTAIALQHVMNEPPSPRALNNGLSPRVEEVILTAMAKNVSERYQSGAALAQALREALQNAGKSRDRLEIPSLPPLPPGMEPPPQRRPSMRPISAEVRASLLAREEATKLSTATVLPTARPMTEPSPPPTTKTIARRSSSPLLLVLLVIILIAGGIGALAVTGNLDNMLTLLDGAATEETVVALAAMTDEPTATETPTDEPTPTATITDEPTVTDEPTATTTLTPTETDEPTATIQPSDTAEPPTLTSSPTLPSTPLAQLRRSISARSGPGSQYGVVAQLEAAAELVIAGISEDGAWFQIELADGSTGWITTSAFVVDALGSVDTLMIVAAPTNTPTPTDAATLTNTLEPTATPIPATATDTPTPGPTEAPKSWLRARFIYDNDMFVWVNASDAMVSSELLTFERVDGDERFFGNRMPRYFINPGRCMQIVFTDVVRQNCPDGVRPISFYTPTRSMGVDFWTGDEGQFRVIWQFEEIAVCEIADGECELVIPPPQ